MDVNKLIVYKHYEDIKNEAVCFAAQLNFNSLPVEVDVLAEKLGIDIIPSPLLKERYDIEAFLSNDKKSIYVDEHIYYHIEKRYRFSIGHELGHYVMHGDFYCNNLFTDADGWMKFYLSLDQNKYNWAEFHANVFSACLLMPDVYLFDKFKAALEIQKKNIDDAIKAGLSHDMYIEPVLKAISMKIAHEFNVSEDAMVRRLKLDKKYNSLIY